MNYGGGCGSNCGSDCVGTETRKVPEADSNYDSDRGRRTFESERDRLEELDRLDRLRERDRLNERNSDEIDGFGTPSRSGIDSRGSGVGSDRGSLETEGNWDRSRNPSRTEEFRNDGFGNDIPGRNRSDFGAEPSTRTEPFDSRRETAPLSTPNNRGIEPFDPEPLDGFPPSTDTFPPRSDGSGGGGFKPVAEEQPGENTSIIEQNTRKPEMPEIEAEDAGAAEDGDEVNGRDFLPADDTTALRSSHTEILKMHRLAGRTRSTRTRASQISSSKSSKRRPARWISLPMPVGRERL